MPYAKREDTIRNKREWRARRRASGIKYKLSDRQKEEARLRASLHYYKSKENRGKLLLARLKELLHYDPLTGIFTWRVRAGRCVEGTIAGTPFKDGGYVSIRVDGCSYLAHRLAYLYMMGRWPEMDIDHRHGNGRDNRWSELRLATDSQNLGNTGLYKRNTSGKKGVFVTKHGTYRVEIRSNGVRYRLGTFSSLVEASKAYNDAAIKLRGEFARVD